MPAWRFLAGGCIGEGAHPWMDETRVGADLVEGYPHLHKAFQKWFLFAYAESEPKGMQAMFVLSDLESHQASIELGQPGYGAFVLTDIVLHTLHAYSSFGDQGPSALRNFAQALTSLNVNGARRVHDLANEHWSNNNHTEKLTNDLPQGPQLAPPTPTPNL